MPWGDRLSAVARTDVERLVNGGLEAAWSALDKAHNFDPIPFLIGVEASARRLDYDRGRLGDVGPDAVARHALQLLVDRAAEARAIALVTVARLSQYEADAIEVWVEHREGEALTVLQPFARSPLGKPHYDEVRAFTAPRVVWAG